MSIAKCGGIQLDGSTLKMVNGIVTVEGGNPTSAVVANCGGIKFDATYFKKIGKVITDKKATAVSEQFVADCGGLLLDADHFVMTDGKLAFDKIDSGCDITSFKIGDVSGIISGTDIAITLPAGTDVTKLKPTITISKDATVSPKSGTQKDFTNPVQYVVTAEDGTTKKTYTVIVTVAASTACDITAFSIGDAEGTIDGSNIAVEVPHGTAVTALTPTITVSEGATVSPTSGTEQDFTNAVTYTVTAEDGETTKVYTVTVTVAEE